MVTNLCIMLLWRFMFVCQTRWICVHIYTLILYIYPYEKYW